VVRALSLPIDKWHKILRIGIMGRVRFSLSHNGILWKVAPRCFGDKKGFKVYQPVLLVFCFLTLARTSRVQIAK
jgi:hypothetical protein